MGASSSSPEPLDVFRMHRELIGDYRQFTEGFVEIRDRRLKDSVRSQSDNGAQWPAPWLSLNPTFASGGTVDDLASRNVLLSESADLFQLKGKPLSLRLIHGV